MRDVGILTNDLTHGATMLASHIPHFLKSFTPSYHSFSTNDYTPPTLKREKSDATSSKFPQHGSWPGYAPNPFSTWQGNRNVNTCVRPVPPTVFQTSLPPDFLTDFSSILFFLLHLYLFPGLQEHCLHLLKTHQPWRKLLCPTLGIIYSRITLKWFPYLISNSWPLFVALDIWVSILTVHWGILFSQK